MVTRRYSYYLLFNNTQVSSDFGLNCGRNLSWQMAYQIQEELVCIEEVKGVSFVIISFHDRVVIQIQYKVLRFRTK